MPIFESACKDESCALYARRVEHYYPRTDSPLCDCEACGKPTARLISRPNLAWLRPLVDYDSRQGETYWKDQAAGGHMVARKRSRGGTPDKPVFERIVTRQQQLAYCREEGVLDPSEIGNVEVHKDGQGMSSQGMPGSWY